MTGQSHTPAALTLCPLNMQLRWSHILCLHTSVTIKPCPSRGSNQNYSAVSPSPVTIRFGEGAEKLSPCHFNVRLLRIVLVSNTYFQPKKKKQKQIIFCVNRRRLPNAGAWWKIKPNATPIPTVMPCTRKHPGILKAFYSHPHILLLWNLSQAVTGNCASILQHKP